MAKTTEIIGLYVATLRAISIIHQQHHWLTKGQNSYGNHLLFERIYESATEDLDLAAEKAIGVFGDECVTNELQFSLLGRILSNFKKDIASSDPVLDSISIEKQFLKLSQGLYEALSEEGPESLTLGVQDAISVIASNREEAIYLLSQVNKED